MCVAPGETRSPMRLNTHNREAVEPIFDSNTPFQIPRPPLTPPFATSRVAPDLTLLPERRVYAAGLRIQGRPRLS